MTTLTGGEAIVSGLVAHGVDTVFGLPGAQVYGLFDAYQFWKRVGVPAGMGIWLGLGPLGLWPFTPPSASHRRVPSPRTNSTGLRP